MPTPRSPLEPASRPVLDRSASALCNLLLLMPHSSVTESSEIDYAAANPALLVQLADAAEASLLIVHFGTSSIGRLLAYGVAEAFGDETMADSVEALGWLVAELGALAEVAHCIAGACRRLTYDYAPQEATTIPITKP